MPDVALILAAGLGTRIGGKPKGLIRVAGRRIVYRTVKLLMDCGVNQFIIVTNEHYISQYKDFVERNGIPARVVLNKNPERGNGHSIYVAGKYLPNRFILIMSDHVYTKAFIRKAVKGNGLIVDRKPNWVDIDEATKVKVVDDHVDEIGKGIQNWTGIDTGFFILSRDILEDVKKLEAERQNYSVTDIVNEASIPVTFVDGEPWSDVDVPEDVKMVRRMLVKTSIKDIGDGFISRHLNRKISTEISALIVDRVDPNQMTIATFLLGVLSAFLALFSIPLAGVMYQVSSILDGVDGEIARAKMKASRLGGYIDSVLDRYVDAIFLSVLAILKLREPFWYMVALLALLGSLMVSYSTERFKAAYQRDAYRAIPLLRKLPGKRDERVFTTMLFLLYPTEASIKALVLLLAAITNLRVLFTVYLVSSEVGEA